MNALERVAWFQLAVVVLTVAVVACLLPWLGLGALGGFGILGFAGLSPYLMRRRGEEEEVVVDERDLSIDRRARLLSANSAWMFALFALIGIVLLHSFPQPRDVSLGMLTWLLYGQITLLLVVRAVVTLHGYRSLSRAT